VTHTPARSKLGYVRIGVVTAALLATPTFSSTPAQAARPDTAAVPCAATGAARTTGGIRIDDTPGLNAAERARTRQEMTSSTRELRATAGSVTLPAHILVPVYVHVIQGSHRGERSVSPTKVRRVMEILRGGYAGRQSAYAAATRYSFTLKKLDFTKNDTWYDTGIFTSADLQMHRKLHRGYSRALNIYIRGLSRGSLGYSRFPWQYASRPFLDGVTVSVAGLPGGNQSGYNRGDTVIHETGHWLGLFHTFQSTCADPYTDGVADTPASTVNFQCNPNLCNAADALAPGYINPALNFMNYSYDSCMRLFTPGQSSRMDAEYALYRY
jgi:hypothetical protein